jgi:hypothetical protein
VPIDLPRKANRQTVKPADGIGSVPKGTGFER